MSHTDSILKRVVYIPLKALTRCNCVCVCVHVCMHMFVCLCVSIRVFAMNNIHIIVRALFIHISNYT